MKIKELLDSPEKWIKCDLCKTKNNIRRGPDSEDAASWCLIGACMKCYPDFKERVLIYDKIIEYLNINNIVEWNDNKDRKFEQIKQLVETLDI